MTTLSFRRTLILLAIAVALLIGGAWLYETHLMQSLRTTPPRATSSSYQVLSTPSSTKSGYDTITWVDPRNAVYGFHFDVPDSWAEQPNGDERSIELDSCSPASAGCNGDTMISLRIQVNPANSDERLVIPNYTKQGEVILASSTIEVDGVLGQTVEGLYHNPDGPGVAPTSAIADYILVNNNNVQYLATVFGSQELQQQAEPVLAGILGSFVFDAPQYQEPPAEYQLIANGTTGWQLTYQDKDTAGLVCSDGDTGTMPNGYAFKMTEFPGTGNIDTPYANAIFALGNDGWTQCNVEDRLPQAPSIVLVKNKRLIEVIRNYSMGAGNSLTVEIQY